MECVLLLRPVNGNYSCTPGMFGERHYTSVCTFSCQPGFSLSHTRALNCTESGLWNGTEPTCININDCNSTSCGVGSTCYDGVQRVYCGITITPSSMRVLTGGSLQMNVISLDSVGGATIVFELNFNDVRQEDIIDVRYGSLMFPTIYQCLNFKLFPNGTVTCLSEPGVGKNLTFAVMYTMKIARGEEVDVRLSETYFNRDRTLTYPLPQFVDKTLRIFDDHSLYEGNPLIGKTTLGEVIDLLGNNFIPLSYPKLMMYYGFPAGNRNYTCALDSNSPITTTQMRCKIQSGGQGTRLVFNLVVMDEINVYSRDTYSYPVVPKVTRVYGCMDVGIRTENCPTQGTTISVEGAGFASGAKVTVAPPAITPTVFNSTFLTFVLGPGVGANLPLVVRASEQDSDGSLRWLSYAPPTVTNITGTGCISSTTGVSQCPKTGTTLTFTGKDFSRTASPVNVLIGTTSCTNVTYVIEHLQFTCQLSPGSRQLLTITLIQDGGLLGQSSTLSVSYFQCQKGTYINEDDGGKCYNCSANYFSIIEGRTECLSCDPGLYSPGGLSFCSSCPVGTASAGGQDCVACVSGTYAPNEGQRLACLTCPPGRFSNSSGASYCFKCVPGKFQKFSNATICDSCEVGKAQRSTEEITCVSCDVGFFANVTGLSDCLVCEPGSFINRSGQESCLLREKVLVPYRNSSDEIILEDARLPNIKVIIPRDLQYGTSGTFSFSTKNGSRGEQILTVEFYDENATLKSISNLSTPIRMQIFQPLGSAPVTMCQEQVPSSETLQCSWLDEQDQLWKASGCTTSLTATYIYCNCSHLTDFAGVFPDLNPVPLRQFLELTPANIQKFPGGALTIGCTIALFAIVFVVSVRRDLDENRRRELLKSEKFAKWNARRRSLAQLGCWARYKDGLQVYHSWGSLLWRKAGTPYGSVDRTLVSLMVLLTLMSMSALFHERDQNLFGRVIVVMSSVCASLFPSLLLTHLFTHTGEMGFLEQWHIDNGLEEHSSCRCLRYRFAAHWRWVWYAGILVTAVGLIVYIMGIALMFDQNPWYYCKGETTLAWVLDFLAQYAISIFLVEPVKILLLVLVGAPCRALRVAQPAAGVSLAYVPLVEN